MNSSPTLQLADSKGQLAEHLTIVGALSYLTIYGRPA